MMSDNSDSPRSSRLFRIFRDHQASLRSAVTTPAAPCPARRGLPSGESIQVQVCRSVGSAHGHDQWHLDIAAVKALREFVKKHPESPLHPKSLVEYQKKCKTMQRWQVQDATAIPVVEKHAGTPRSFYAYRAALVREALDQGRAAMRQRDKNKPESGGYTEAMVTIRRALNILTTYPPGGKLDHLAQRREQQEMARLGLDDPPAPGVFATAQAAKSESTGKPQGGKALAANRLNKRHPEWRDELHQHLVGRGSIWATWAAVASLTGCRPAEIPGMRISLEGDGRLRFLIHGAKVSDTKGQPLRRLILGEDSALHRYVVAQVTAAGGRMDVSVPPAESERADALAAFEAALRRAGVRAFGKAAGFSAYCFRHAIAADLKSDGTSREDLAVILGHAVTATASIYGRVSGGRRGVRSIEAYGTRIVKVNHLHGFGLPTGGEPSTVAPEVVTPDEPEDSGPK
jgi:hypothetical protein